MVARAKKAPHPDVVAHAHAMHDLIVSEWFNVEQGWLSRAYVALQAKHREGHGLHAIRSRGRDDYSDSECPIRVCDCGAEFGTLQDYDQHAHNFTAQDWRLYHEYHMRTDLHVLRTRERNELVMTAVAEYLRRFPSAHSPNGHVYSVSLVGYMQTSNRDTREWDFVCVFCRTSLNTLPFNHGTIAGEPIVAHGELCAMKFLAGMIEGKKPGVVFR